MGWFNWFGSGKKESSGKLEGDALEYLGYTIRATLIPEDGQFRICGRIEKDGQSREFIRSDLIPDQQQAEKITLGKATMIIDQLGDQVFEVGHI